MYYDFNKFKNYIKSLKNIYGGYFLEIMLTDFFCIYQQVNPKLIYITPEVADNGIDSIIVDKSRYEDGKDLMYIIQISSDYKDKGYLEEFKKKDIFSINKYENILENYNKKNVKIKKVLITLKWGSWYDDFNKSILIFSNKEDELYLMLYEYSIKNSLITKECELEDRYIKDLQKRKKMWEEINRRLYQKDIIKLYLSLLNKNYKFISELECDFVSEVEKLIKNKINNLLDLFKNLKDSESKEKVLNMKYEEIQKLISIFEVTGKKNTDYMPVIKLIKSLSKLKNEVSELNKIKTVITKEYISIYNRKNNIAYLYYIYDNRSNKKAIFCFNYKFEKLKKIDNDLIQDYIKNNIISKRDKNVRASVGKDTVLNINKLKNFYSKVEETNDNKEFIYDKIIEILEILLKKSCEINKIKV